MQRSPVQIAPLDRMLDRCARAIMLKHNDDPDLAEALLRIDFRSVHFAFRTGRIAVLMLTEKVEAASENKLTVRKADPKLYEEKPFSTQTINLAVCPFRTPPNRVIERMDDTVTLFRIGPVIPGLRFCKPADPSSPST